MTCPDHPDIVRAMEIGDNFSPTTTRGKSSFLCDGCCNPIFEGQKYVDFFGDKLCMECIKEHTCTFEG